MSPTVKAKKKRPKKSKPTPPASMLLRPRFIDTIVTKGSKP